jgi:hypothetical protein
MVLKRSATEIEEMRERKKQKNRESAQRARDRFKAKMRWLEDQVRHITERHDNLLRENTYMRHMLSEQTQKLNHLLQRENDEMEKERTRRKSPTTSNNGADSSGDDSNDSGIRSPQRQKHSSFSINFLSKSSKGENSPAAGNSPLSSSKLADRITSPLTPSITKAPTTNAQGKTITPATIWANFSSLTLLEKPFYQESKCEKMYTLAQDILGPFASNVKRCWATIGQTILFSSSSLDQTSEVFSFIP